METIKRVNVFPVEDRFDTVEKVKRAWKKGENFLSRDNEPISYLDIRSFNLQNEGKYKIVPLYSGSVELAH